MTVQVRTRGRARLATINHRKRVDRLTATQLQHVRSAFAQAMALTDERGYWYFAGWHGEPFKWCEHNSELFLPWHRAYLRDLELALQALQPGVSLPWWDWTAGAALPAAYTAAEQPDGTPNPLLGSRYRIYRSPTEQQAPPRDPGGIAQVPSPPYTRELADAMAATSFTDFQRRLEGIHNNVHVWVGGIMQDIQLAAYDPVFFAHHVMVDRAWRIWQHANPGALPPTRLLDVALRPNGTKVRDVLDVKAMGYDYAGVTAHVKGTR